MARRGIEGLIAYPRSREFARNGVRVGMEPQEFAVAVALCASAPVALSYDDMFALLWGDPEDGGPDFSLQIIRNRVGTSRAKLKALGIAFRPAIGLGYYAFDLSIRPDRGRAAGKVLPATSCGEGGISTAAGRQTVPDQSQQHPTGDFADLPGASLIVAGDLHVAALHAPKHGETAWNGRYGKSNNSRLAKANNSSAGVAE